jgi:DNA polymerase/3'-5' exonuclease PolX
MGIGSVGAEQLIKQGVKSIDDLKKLKWYTQLPEAAQIFLKYNPNRKIPHEHMLQLQPLICGFKGESVRGLYSPNVTMVGSFRRETPFSRDFDIMIVSDNPATLIDYEYYLSLKIGTTYRYSSGDDRISFLIEIPKKMLKTEIDMVYKFDVFRTPKTNQSSMLLYATGSKLFNIRMRARAKRLGYLLNQDGLFYLKDGKKINIQSEKGFFEALDMDYMEPKDRN